MRVNMSAAFPAWLARLALMACVFSASAGAEARNCNSKGSGDWSAKGSWTACGGNVPGYLDTATIVSGHTINLDIDTGLNGAMTSLVINSGGTLVGTSGHSLNVRNITNNNSAASSIDLDGVIVTGGGLWTGAAGGSWNIQGIELQGDVRFNSSDSFTINMNGAEPMVAGGYGSINGDAANSTVTFNYARSGNQIVDVTYTDRTIIYPRLTLSGGGTKTAATNKTNWGGSVTLTVLGDLTIDTGTSFAGSGAGNISNPTVNLYGSLLQNGSGFSAGSGPWTLAGGSSVAQSIGGSPTFASLTVNNSGAGVTLAGNVTVSGQLALTQGVVTTGTNLLSAGLDCRTGVTRGTGYVDGNLRYTFPNPSSNAICTYHVGSNGVYAPISFVANSTGGGTLSASTTTNSHLSLASSGINGSRDVNRYWTLWRSGDTLALSSYAATFNFASSDIDGGANWSNFILGMYVAVPPSGGVWSTPSNASASATTISVSNVSGGLAAVTDFATGEGGSVAPSTCNAPADFPGATCLCDNFTRTSLNPSPIFNNDWVVGHSSGTFGDPAIYSGRLRLTEASGNIATVATLPGQFPAAGNKITVEFLQHAYGGTGGDGVVLTLSDASVTPAAGAYGGSLGYAQKTGIDGFAGGWLGVGLDEYGNFATSGEGRSGGSTSRVPQSVTLRGSGIGSSGYPFINTSGTISSPAIDSHSAGHMYRITVDARDYTATNPVTKVKVERDTTGVGSYPPPILNLSNIYTNNTAQAVVPSNWKLSFTGATGGSNNIHEISALKVCSASFTAPGSFTIETNVSAGLSCATYGGTPAPPIITISARDSGGVLNTGYLGTVTLGAKVGGTLSATASWHRVGGAAIANGGTYTYIASDAGVAQFYLIDTAGESLTLSASDSAASSTLATPLVFSNNASLEIENVDAIGPVAGRPQLMKVIYRASGCGSTSGATPVSRDLSGWYTTVAGDPGGAAPRLCTVTGSGGTCFDAGGGAATCVDGRGNNATQVGASAPASANLRLAFDNNSAAYFCLASTDVGKYYPQLRVTSTPATTTVAAPTLTLPPFAVAVWDVAGTRNALPVANPAGAASAATSANGGAAFVAAGAPFHATVGGYRWNATGDQRRNVDNVVVIGGDGLPDAGTTLSQVTGAGVAPHYVDIVTLSVDAFGPPAAPIPAPVLATSLANGAVAVNAGSATPNMTYSEVGAFTLGASASNNYLGALDLNSRVAIFAGGEARSQVVGRFFPDHFAVAASSVAYGCGTGATGFTYQGRPFALNFTLEAQNALNGRTRNYGAAGYGPLSGGVLGLVAENANNGVSLNPAGAPRLAAPAAIAAADWGAGQYVVNGNNTFTRAAAADGPFDTLELGLTMADNSGDAVPLTGLNMNPAGIGDCVAAGNCSAVKLVMSDLAASTRMRWGRMRIDNAYGSEQLPLKVNVEAQYWTGAAFVRNTFDGAGSAAEKECTSLAAAQFAPLAPGSGAAITTSIVDPASATFLSAGAGSIRLARPTNVVNGKGSVVLSTTAPLSNYLPGSGRETFGVYKSGPVIYIREMF